MGVFTRRAISGGDIGVWAGYEEAQNEAGVGIMTNKLYNDGGVLRLSAGLIGIDDGTNKGMCKFTSTEIISLTGCSNSTWAKIELSVSGTATTLAAADIAGATDCTIIPASVKAAYNGLKGGFYLTATKRLVGLAWKNSSGVLLAIINLDGAKWWASQIGLHTSTIHEQSAPGRGFQFNTTWDMDTINAIQPVHAFGIFYKAIEFVSAQVTTGGAELRPLNMAADSADPTLRSGGYAQAVTTQLYFTRRTGGTFDYSVYNAATLYYTVHMRDF